MRTGSIPRLGIGSWPITGSCCREPNGPGTTGAGATGATGATGAIAVTGRSICGMMVGKATCCSACAMLPAPKTKAK